MKVQLPVIFIGMKSKYSKDLLIKIVAKSISVAGVLRLLGLKLSGGNHSYITSCIKKYEIDISHFLGSRANSGPGHVPKKLSPDQILLNNRLYGRRDCVRRLRRALLESGVDHKCKICELPPYWNDQYLQLQIDHINGIGTDNRIENLRFLCGNCHLQTENFGIKNSLSYINKKNMPKQELVLVIPVKLQKPSKINPGWRNNPRLNKRKVIRPCKEELEKLLWEKPTTHLAKNFNVSGKAIEKWAKIYGITKPPRGYWAKKNSNKKI